MILLDSTGRIESKKDRFVNESVLFSLSRLMKFINIKELSTGTSLLYLGFAVSVVRAMGGVADDQGKITAKADPHHDWCPFMFDSWFQPCRMR